MASANFGSSKKYSQHSEPQLWREDSQRKTEWVAKNPQASEAEYDAAVKRIADELGV